MKAQIWNYSRWIKECNPERLYYEYSEKLIKAGFKVLDSLTHNFSPQGYTAIFLLAESHFAIHTFPEEKKTYIELSSCNKEYFERFIKMINDNV